MLLLLLSIIGYILLSLVTTKTFLTFSPLIFLLVVYVLPIGLNAVVVGFQKNKLFKQLAFMLTPTLSTLFYITFAYAVSQNGDWIRYMELQTITDGNVSIELATSLFDLGQIAFMLLVYYGSSTLHFYMQQKQILSEQKGVSHA